MVGIAMQPNALIFAPLIEPRPEGFTFERRCLPLYPCTTPLVLLKESEGQVLKSIALLENSRV
jgi:hypothetical protein